MTVDHHSILAGEAAAKALLARLQTSPPDLLLAELQHLFRIGDVERLRAFCRTIQKAIEGAGHE